MPKKTFIAATTWLTTEHKVTQIREKLVILWVDMNQKKTSMNETFANQKLQ